VSWQRVVKAAELVRDVLETLRLVSWVKTTGGRGLHVVVPLKPKRTVSECLDFSRAVSESIAATDPQSYTTAFAKAGRERQILIDWGYNPTRDMAGELRGMFEDLAPHKDRIVEKLHVICPDIRWGGEKKICESLLGDSQ